MFGLIDAKTYLLISLFTAAVLYLIYQFDRARAVVGFFQGIQSDAVSAGLPTAAADIVTQPFILAMTEPIGIVVGGLAWPALVIWFLMLFLLVMFAFLSPLISNAINIGR